MKREVMESKPDNAMEEKFMDGFPGENYGTTHSSFRPFRVNGRGRFWSL
jgi:hypothetical protein